MILKVIFQTQNLNFLNLKLFNMCNIAAEEDLDQITTNSVTDITVEFIVAANDNNVA